MVTNFIYIFTTKTHKCANLDVLLICACILSGYASILPQLKEVHIRVTSDLKCVIL